MELREYRRSKEGQLSDGINPPNIINFKMLGSEIGFLGKKIQQISKVDCSNINEIFK